MAALATTLSTQNTTPPTKQPTGQIDTAEKNPKTDELSATESRQQRIKQQNLNILEANRQASLSIPGQPLSLLYQTAIEAINAELAPTMGDNAIERAQQEELDISPEATADRIISLSMRSFGKFQAHHPEMSESDQADRFFELISSGIEQGFNAAKDILKELSVLEGSIAENIAKTYELVQQGLQQYRLKISADDSNESA